MQQKSTETPLSLPQILEFPSTDDGNVTGDPASSSFFGWSNFLDFDLDDNLNLTFDPQAIHGPESESGPGVDPIQPQSQQPNNSTRVRKRGPRLACSNFLAGRIPCACPELDAKLEEEASGDQSGKKRVRTVRVPIGATARCQVPDCEADISKLKGYHKRHRVCLQCANAGMVVLDGESKRYCQQCGKTVLAVQVLSFALKESEGHMSTISSGLGSQTIQRDSFVSFAASSETHLDGEKEKPKPKYSPSYCENKSPFSSVCPAVRISFKLYDWNPAEFPRRLRHQVF